MSTEVAFATDLTLQSRRSPVVQWAPVLLGLLALYVPTFVDLSRTVWRTEDHAHGPIILAIIIWIVWRQRAELVEAPSRSGSATGFFALVFGLLVYSIGRSQDILVFEVGSLMPVMAGVIWLTHGLGTLRSFAFAVLLIVFLVPLPGFIVDTLTLPLKEHVSTAAERVLYLIGYPVARSGVVLTIGPYQLLVADACSGLNSMISLASVGLLYVYLMQYRSRFYNLFLLLTIIPIAFFANVVRVILLVLITFHVGDSAAQGVAHGLAGMILFVVAVMLLLLVDGIARCVPGIRKRV